MGIFIPLVNFLYASGFIPASSNSMRAPDLLQNSSLQLRLPKAGLGRVRNPKIIYTLHLFISGLNLPSSGVSLRLLLPGHITPQHLSEIYGKGFWRFLRVSVKWPPLPYNAMTTLVTATF